MQELKFITEPDLSDNNEYDMLEMISGNDYVMIDWVIGTTCNYSCTYCDPEVNDGTYPWPDFDVALEFVKETTKHYKTLRKRVLWNLLGGEPTVWKEFIPFVEAVKENDPDCVIRILTNGSRTINWWKRASKVLDDVIISFHPETAKKEHVLEVSNVLFDAGVQHSCMVCLYPGHLDYCYETAKFLHIKSRMNSVIVKSLKKTLKSPETFDYDKDFLADVMKFDGEPLLLSSNNNETISNIKKKDRTCYGKHMRYLNVETGKQKFVWNANILMAEGRNSWVGWDCNIGLETLAVTPNGGVKAGSSCNPNSLFGFIHNPKEIKFPTKPVRCEWKWCSCIADIECTKVKPK